MPTIRSRDFRERADATGRLSRRQTLRSAALYTAGGGLLGRRQRDGNNGDPPRVVGHRGCMDEAPENTVAGVRHAVSHADGVELDVRRCGTGKLVVFHDASLGRVTDTDGRVAETACSEVTTAEVLDSDEPVPTLAEALAAVPDGFPVILDLKAHGIAADAVDVAAEAGVDAVYSAFDPAVVQEVRGVSTEASTAFIVRERRLNRIFRPLIPGVFRQLYFPEDTVGIVDRAITLDCEEIHARYELLLRTDLVARAHDAGLRVLAWTLTEQREYDALREAGVDAVISDRCREFGP